jgi:putative heme-binding domain-containing protein
VLLDGWGYQDTHETLNAFTWGPDGWLYGCHGVFTHSTVGKPGTPKPERIALNAAIWRYHPTRHVFEVFAHGTSNPWGVDFDDHGETFCTACVIPHLFHIIPGARYHRQAGSHFNRHTFDDIKTIADHVHWVGGTPHGGNNRSDVAGGGHAHSGAMIYLGDAWPEKYRGQIFMNNIHGARINVDSLEPKGSGYVGHHERDFLLANDQWSQILNLYYGPDGQVYIIDWYDANQCHRLEHDIHDRSNGRIFKISYGNSRSLPVDLTALGDLQLVDLLLHKNDWYVRHARRLLQERAAAGKLSDGVKSRLATMALEHHDETRRLRGLWALHVTGLLDDELIARGLENDRPFVRAWTARLAAENGARRLAWLPKFTAMAQSDNSPVVRQYLSSIAQQVPPAERFGLLAALTSHSEDNGDHNLPLLYWYALEPTIDVDAPRALAIAEQSPVAPLLEFTSRKIAGELQVERLALLVDALGRTNDAKLQMAILDGIAKGLAGQRRVARPDNWSQVAAKLYDSPEVMVRQHARALAVTLGDPQALAEMRQLIVDVSADLEARRAALASLLGARDENLAETLHALLAAPELRSEALRGLAAYDHPQTPRVILEAYGQLNPGQRREALATLAARKAYARALLDALSEGRVPSSDISADIIRQLRNLKDDRLDERIREVWGEVRDTSADVAARIDHYRKLLKEKPEQQPDLALGRAMFVKTCQQCHTLFGVGGKVGPELTGSNRADLEYLLSNMLDPSALIAKDYMASVVVTTDGRVLTGIIRGDDDPITLLMQNETLILPRGEIEQIERSEKSMMPDDVLQPLSEHQVRSLVAYLASPAQTPLLATADTAPSLFNGVDLTGWRGDEKLWSVDQGEIVGRSPGLGHNEFLVSDLEASDFRLKLQVKLTPNLGNSGIQFRSKPLDDGEVQGYQADVGLGWWGKLYEERGRGLLWKHSGEKFVRPGEWNDYEIVAQGSQIRTYINGNLCTDLDDPQGQRRGIFALQIHSGPAMEVRFRNLQLELEPEPERTAQAEAATGQ